MLHFALFLAQYVTRYDQTKAPSGDGDKLALVLGMGGFMLFFIIFVVFVLPGFFIVEPRQARVLLRFGTFSRTVQTPGIHWAFPIGLQKLGASLRDAVGTLPVVTVVEASGNPIQVSAVVVYRVVDARRALLDIRGYHAFVMNQASAALKAICSRYAYSARTSGEPCLKAESPEVLAALQSALQEHVNHAGIEIVLVRLNDLTYAPEIAQAMLLRQQAQAMIEARRTLVDGAVGIAQDALAGLATAGLQLRAPARTALLSNLTLLLCDSARNDRQNTVVSRTRTSTGAD